MEVYRWLEASREITLCILNPLLLRGCLDVCRTNRGHNLANGECLCNRPPGLHGVCNWSAIPLRNKRVGGDKEGARSRNESLFPSSRSQSIGRLACPRGLARRHPRCRDLRGREDCCGRPLRRPGNIPPPGRDFGPRGRQPIGGPNCFR
jgi:hypothetical protein